MGFLLLLCFWVAAEWRHCSRCTLSDCNWRKWLIRSQSQDWGRIAESDQIELRSTIRQIKKKPERKHPPVTFAVIPRSVHSWQRHFLTERKFRSLNLISSSFIPLCIARLRDMLCNVLRYFPPACASVCVCLYPSTRINPRWLCMRGATSFFHHTHSPVSPPIFPIFHPRAVPLTLAHVVRHHHTPNHSRHHFTRRDIHHHMYNIK